jgi:hypothetical protein
MAIFDVNNPPDVPTEALDPDLSLEKTYKLPSTGRSIKIAPGDWVDVSPVGIGEDPRYGTSFQVANTYDGLIAILFSNDYGESYSPVSLDLCWVMNNYRKT